MSQLERLVPMNGEGPVETHEQEIGQIINEMNLQDSALVSVNTALKKSATVTLSLSPSDYVAGSSTFFNKFGDKSFTHGLPYVPIVFAYVTYSGGTYQTPFQVYDPSTGNYQGTIDVTPGSNTVDLVANLNGITPAVTAYIYISTATANFANS